MVGELTMDKLSSLIYKEAEDKGFFLSSSFFLITQFNVTETKQGRAVPSFTTGLRAHSRNYWLHFSSLLHYENLEKEISSKKNHYTIA